jgi:hypothetical protein
MRWAILFFGLSASAFASATLEVLVDAASSVSATIQQQLEISKAIPRFGANPSNALINGSGGLLYSLMPARQNPKNHQRDKDQVYHTSDGNGPVRRGRRAAGFTDRAALGAIAQAGSWRAESLLVTARAHVDDGALPSHREGSSAFRQFDPSALEDAEALTESRSPYYFPEFNFSLAPAKG